MPRTVPHHGKKGRRSTGFYRQNCNNTRCSSSPDRYLALGKTLLLQADPEIAPQLGELDLNPGLSRKPRLGRAVVHDSGDIGYRALGLELPVDAEAKVPRFPEGIHFELLPALLVLNGRSVIEYEADPPVQREVFEIVLVPLQGRLVRRRALLHERLPVALKGAAR